MASITQTQAEYFSKPDLSKKAYLHCNESSQILSVLKFVPLKGHALDAVNYNTPGAAATVDPSSPSLSDSATTLLSPVSFSVARIAGEIDLTEMYRTITSQIRDVLQSQVDGKIRAIRNEFLTDFTEGSGTNGEMTGLSTAVDGSQTVQKAGSPLALADLDELLGKIRPFDEESDRYLLMRHDVYRAYRALCYSAGFRPELVEDATLGLWPSHDGVPILISDFIPNDEEASGYTSVYAFIAGDGDEEEGAGVVGIYPESNANNEIVVKGPIQKDGSDADYYHVYWDVGVALLRKCALARLSQIAAP